jgi:hypothetical protein
VTANPVYDRILAIFSIENAQEFVVPSGQDAL